MVADACGSPIAFGHDIALQRIAHEGITLATTASVIDGDRQRQIIPDHGG